MSPALPRVAPEGTPLPAAELSLRELGLTLLDIFDARSLGIAICDAELRYVAVNHTLAASHGIPASAHRGRTLREVLGAAAAPLEQIIRRVLVTGRSVLNVPVAAQLSARREPGKWIGNYFPIKNASGAVSQVGVIVVDVTPRCLNEPQSVPCEAKNVTIPHLPPGPKLTARETDVVRLLAHGKSTKEIAAALSLAAKTIETYRARIHLKLSIHSVGELVLYAVRTGIVEV